MRPHHFRPQPAASDDGFVVVAVLWLLGMLGMLVSIYAVYVIGTAASLSVHDERLQSDALISAAVELTAGRLKTESRLKRDQFEFSLAQANVAVSYRSEAARIDLNTAPKQLFAGLFKVLGATRAASENYADRVVGWRTSPPDGNDAEAAAYRSAHAGYVPRGAPFPHVHELSLVLGLPSALVERALPFVTVYSGRQKINVLDAAPEVLAALPGVTLDRLNSVLAERQRRADEQRLLSLLGPGAEFASVEDSRASRITVDVSFNTGRRLTAEVVILPFEGGDAPYAVLSREDLSDRASENSTLAGVR